MRRPAVLIVDDEPDLLELVSLTLNRMNLETSTAPVADLELRIFTFLPAVTQCVITQVPYHLA